MFVTRRESERRSSKVWQAVDLRQEARCTLDRTPRRCISPGQESITEMLDPLEAFQHTSKKKFAAPNASVIAVTRAIEADADHALIPGFFFRQNRRYVGAMMLYTFFPRGRQVEGVSS